MGYLWQALVNTAGTAILAVIACLIWKWKYQHKASTERVEDLANLGVDDRMLGVLRQAVEANEFLGQKGLTAKTVSDVLEQHGVKPSVENKQGLAGRAAGSSRTNPTDDDLALAISLPQLVFIAAVETISKRNTLNPASLNYLSASVYMAAPVLHNMLERIAAVMEQRWDATAADEFNGAIRSGKGMLYSAAAIVLPSINREKVNPANYAQFVELASKASEEAKNAAKGIQPGASA